MVWLEFKYLLPQNNGSMLLKHAFPKDPKNEHSHGGLQRNFLREAMKE